MLATHHCEQALRDRAWMLEHDAEPAP